MTSGEEELIALIPAAGRGERFGGARPKQFELILGRPVLLWTLEHVLTCEPRRVVIAVPVGQLEEAHRILAAEPDPRIRWVEGGATRQQSVTRALAAAPGSPQDLILIHDGARPAFHPEDAKAVVAAAQETGAAILGRSIADTVKRVVNQRVVETVERSTLFRAETPQVFRRALLQAALVAAEREGRIVTDEASLFEHCADVETRAVRARWPNPKLTEPSDLQVIETLLGAVHP